MGARGTMRRTAVAACVAVIMLGLSGCMKPDLDGDYVYGYYPIKDETIDRQTLSAHRGIEQNLTAGGEIEWDAKARSLVKPHGDDFNGAWFQEKGMLTLACEHADMNALTGVGCGRRVPYVLDWDASTGDIIGFMADGSSVIDNPNEPVDNTLDDE